MTKIPDAELAKEFMGGCGGDPLTVLKNQEWSCASKGLSVKCVSQTLLLVCWNMEKGLC